MPSSLRTGVLLAIALAAGTACAATAPSFVPKAPLAPMDTLQRRLAGPAGFGAADFDLLVNYRTTPPPAPSVVLSLLRDPHGSDSLLPALTLAAADLSGEGVVRAEPLWPWIDIAAPTARVFKTLDPASAFRLLEAAQESLREYVAALDPAEQSFLVREAPGLVRYSGEDTALNPIERERERLRGGIVTDSVMRLAERLPPGALAASARDLDAVLQGILRMLRTQGSGEVLSRLEAMQRQGLPVVMGTSGEDYHKLDRGIVFDPGGNDHYEFPGSPRPGSWLLVIDADGDDTYAAHDTAGGTGAFLSVQILADLKGNDRYVGEDFAFGSAILGFARLLDVEGDDSYEGRSGSLGFAFRGMGILQDRSGNDTYSSAYLSQAASSSFGFALLLDEGGDDHYISRPEFVDDLRYRDRFLSLSQGFSTGMAPKYGGGIAVLLDQAGNDRYTADIFGQGAGYWFGWGALLDDAGDDTLRAYQYAQGAGIHFAVGTLLDVAGNDKRESKGVSQGCGHDGGFGLMVDARGNDANIAVDMSTGAGSANGLGVFLDFAGEDAYRMGNPAMTLGHGDMRRDRGSMGFFLDRGGRDSYPDGFFGEGGGGGTGRAWRVYDGKRRGNGYGLDINEE